MEKGEEAKNADKNTRSRTEKIIELQRYKMKENK